MQKKSKICSLISFPVASVLFKQSTVNSQQSPDGVTGIDMT